MSQHAMAGNPFLLMLNPEVVLAAIEKSERLGQLNRRMCRPLDRVAPAAAVAEDEEVGNDDDEAVGIDDENGSVGSEESLGS